MESVKLIADVVTALAATLIGVMAFRLSLSSSRTAAERAIGDLANSLAQLRVAHPEVLWLARGWTLQHWDALYGKSEATTDVVRYYSYVEIGLEFCNTTLRARATRRMTPTAFSDHYRPLVRYFITENWPIIQQMIDGPYLSQYIRAEIDAAKAEGWVWSDRHASLALTDTGDHDHPAAVGRHSGVTASE